MPRDGGQDWQVVWQGDAEPHAELVAGHLRTRGIHALSDGIRPGTVGAVPLLRSGTWFISVQDDDAAAARRLLRDIGEEVFMIEPAGSSPGISRDQRATLMFAAAGLLAVIAYLVYAAAKGSL